MGWFVCGSCRWDPVSRWVLLGQSHRWLSQVEAQGVSEVRPLIGLLPWNPAQVIRQAYNSGDQESIQEALDKDNTRLEDEEEPLNQRPHCHVDFRVQVCLVTSVALFPALPSGRTSKDDSCPLLQDLPSFQRSVPCPWPVLTYTWTSQ